VGKVTDNWLPWARFYDPAVPLNLEYPEVTLCTLFNETVVTNGDSTALIYFGKTLTYTQLSDQVAKMANSLKDLKVGKGGKLALILPNCPQFVIGYYAGLFTGATVVPVNPLSTETELLHIFQDSTVSVVICLDLLADRVERVRDRLKASGEEEIAKHVYYTSLKDYMPFPLKLLYPFKQKLSPEAKVCLAGAEAYKSLINGSSSVEVPQVDLHKDIAVLIYTGGTTGKPKGVMLSHHALVVNASQVKAWVEMNESERLLTVLPVFHGFGMSVCMNGPIASGASIILVPRFEAGDVLKNIDRHKPTLFAGVPTMFIALINHPKLNDYSLSSLRACYVGAAALPPEIKKQFEGLTGARLMEGYGLTESVTAICANPYTGENKTGSIGMPFPDVIMGIRDMESGEEELSAGEVGEIVLKSPSVMLGYYNRPMETAGALRNGWLYTGDVGMMDADGYFYIVDRKKDMIISGGFNVYPREVEDILYSHPAVKEASVIGVPDPYKGERVKAYVTLKEGANSGETEIITFCKQHLSPYKVPRQVEFCQELPKTAIGKVLKRALREMDGAVPATNKNTEGVKTTGSESNANQGNPNLPM
jgi:long-chain acyl-CoA synthetase